MVKKPVCLAQRPVKTGRKIEVRVSHVQGTKLCNNFGFRMFDFGISLNAELLILHFRKKMRSITQSKNKSEIEHPKPQSTLEHHLKTIKYVKIPK